LNFTRMSCTSQASKHKNQLSSLLFITRNWTTNKNIKTVNQYEVLYKKWTEGGIFRNLL